MRATDVFAAVLLGLTLTCNTLSAAEQSGSANENDTRNRRNQWTVGLAGGQFTGTYMRFADEIALALDEPDKLRVLPIVSYGAASNLDDLLYLRNVDVAITQADVFEYFRTERKIPNLDSKVHYIVRLPASELHILARQDIKSVEDLRGRKVSLGPAGSGSSITGSIVLQRLGIQVEPVLVDNAQALQKLRSGEIAALIRVISKPVDFFTKIAPDSGLHLLSIPYSKLFADYYTMGEFDSKDYPSLIPDGSTVDTIAVPVVLAAFNWKPGTDRHRRVERFTQKLLSSIEKMQAPPYHPKWKDVRVSATVPGWRRFSAADQVLAKLSSETEKQQQDVAREFQLFLAKGGDAQVQNGRVDKEKLFEEFLQWQRSRGSRTEQSAAKPVLR